MSGTPLADAFLSATGDTDRPDRDAIEKCLVALCERGEAQAPELASSRAEFATYLGGHALAARWIGGPDADTAHVDDDALVELRLVCALRRGQPSAVRVFERRYIVPLADTLAAMRLSEDVLDEVRQRVRTKLIVPDHDGALRLEAYAGRGRLAGLVQVAATREAIDIVRAARREEPSPDDDLWDAPGAGNDPELQVVRARNRGAFKAAFEDAIHSLDSRERNLLKLHFVGAIGLEQLATMYGVHRATIVRWLARARAHVLSSTKSTLRERLGLGTDELDGVLAVVESRFDLSVERMLRTVHEPAGDVAADALGAPDDPDQ